MAGQYNAYELYNIYKHPCHQRKQEGRYELLEKAIEILNKK